MEVRYFADIRPLAGTDEEKRPAAPTVQALLSALAAEKGPAFASRVLEGGKLSDAIIILVNGRHIDYLNGVQTPLSADDVVAVFPMVGGG